MADVSVPGILIGVLTVTTYASLDCSILAVGKQLTSDPWFHATLADGYFGFLTFYVWVAYKDVHAWREILWFVFIMPHGNIAMAVCVLLQLWSWNEAHGAAGILLRSELRAT